MKIKLKENIGKWKKGEVKTTDDKYASELIKEGIAVAYKEKPQSNKVEQF